MAAAVNRCAQTFRRTLLDHFDRNRRPLPWRSERTPYRVLVSEFMLQQTRAETVIPYYARWLRRFPGWNALADARLDDVLREWKGLGYYRRAHNLHRTARVVRDRFGGRLPEDPEALRELPGVGEYTAGAVASIAFGRPVPAVDGNVRRVLCRVLDLEAPTPAQLRDEASRLLDPGRPGDFNEAMMELGATVCRPRSPECGRCPVEGWCRARARGTVGERPGRRERGRVPRVEFVTVVVVGGEEGGRGGSSRVKTLVVKRPGTGLLAGMWEFPSAESGVGEEKRGQRARAAAADRLLRDLGLRGRVTAHLDPVPHAFTHLHATYRPVIVTLPLGDTTPADGPLPHGVTAPADGPHGLRVLHAAWTPPARLDDFALPVAQQKIAALLRDWLRGRRPRASG